MRCGINQHIIFLCVSNIVLTILGFLAVRFSFQAKHELTSSLGAESIPAVLGAFDGVIGVGFFIAALGGIGFCGTCYKLQWLICIYLGAFGSTMVTELALGISFIFLKNSTEILTRLGCGKHCGLTILLAGLLESVKLHVTVTVVVLIVQILMMHSTIQLYRYLRNPSVDAVLKEVIPMKQTASPPNFPDDNQNMQPQDEQQKNRTMVYEEMGKMDPNSFSNPDVCEISDMHLNLKVDFGRQLLFGYVDILVLRKDPKADAVILDAKDLVIQNVKNKSTLKKMNYTLGDPVLTFGSKLEIKLPKTATKKFNIRIEYETSPKASALQWLDSSQTAGKVHPYMFSQCQAIHARSMVPCQDTPYVKFTYSASITAPSTLTVLMSALRDGEEAADDRQSKVSKFVQKVPIPSYLLAVAVGALKSKKIGPRSHVWSEKEYIEKAAYEFSETESMIKTAEELLGPYVWEIYDILLLPPSFPYGGMENPCLTFLTPTLLAGDKSLADVVAHEITHSWTGNLVTNKDFQDFWLNEGFTMFVERKIIGRMHGESHRHFHAIGGWKDLKYTIETRGKEDPLTKLVPDLKGIDPDDAFSSVPYEKGHTLLFYLENLLGGPEVFEPFLKAYIEKFKFQSISTDDWKSYLYEYFTDKKDILDAVDWEAWLYTPGMPPVKPDYDTSLADKCSSLCKSWVEADASAMKNFKKTDLKDMSSNQIIEFLSSLLQEEPLSEEKMQKLTEVYNLKNVTNAEIRFRWLRLGLLAHWKPIIPHAIKFVTEQGRLKYQKPLYRDLYNWEETLEMALSTYKKHFNEMMYISAYTIGKDLHLDKETMEQIKIS